MPAAVFGCLALDRHGLGGEDGGSVEQRAVVLAAALAIVSIVILMRLLDARSHSEAVHRRHDECTAAANDLMIASDHLTTQSRMYVVTGGPEYLDAYLDELLTARRRDHAVSTL